MNKNIFLSVFSFFILLFSSINISYAIDCKSGWYSCQNETMCCFGGGCPSYCRENSTCTEWVWGECQDKPFKECEPGNPDNCWIETPISHPCSKCVGSTENVGCGCYGGGEEEEPPNQPPKCSITSLDPDPTAVGADPIYAGQDIKIKIKAKAWDPDGSVKKRSWSCGTKNVCGTFSNSNSVNTEYTPGPWQGTVTLKLTVTDNGGASGSCSKTINMIPGYNLTLHSWKKDPPTASCDVNSPSIANVKFAVRRAGNLPDYNENLPVLLSGANAKSDANGNYTLSISRLITAVDVTAVYEPADVCQDYFLACAQNDSSNKFDISGNGFRVNFGDMTLATAPLNPPTVHTGFEEVLKDPWVTAIDADIISKETGNGLPCLGITLLGGYKASMINIRPNTSWYISAWDRVCGSWCATYCDEGIATCRCSSGCTCCNREVRYYFRLTGNVFSKGPVLPNLKTLPIVTCPNGRWAYDVGEKLGGELDNLSFVAPNHDRVKTLTSLNNSYVSTVTGYGVYKMSASAFNSSMTKCPDGDTACQTATQTYPSAAGTPAFPGMIIYVEKVDNNDADELIIARNKKATLPVILITDLPVIITKDIGTATPVLGAAPSLGFAIISSKNITVEGNQGSVDTLSATLQGPLISKSEILFERNLGYANSTKPPQTVSQFTTGVLYELTKFEREMAKLGYKSATGLGVYDIKWSFLD